MSSLKHPVCLEANMKLSITFCTQTARQFILQDIQIGIMLVQWRATGVPEDLSLSLGSAFISKCYRIFLQY